MSACAPRDPGAVDWAEVVRKVLMGCSPSRQCRLVGCSSGAMRGWTRGAVPQARYRERLLDLAESGLVACTMCDRGFAVEEFGTNAQGSLCVWCSACRAKGGEGRGKRRKPLDEPRTCTQCGVTKSANAFARYRRKRHGYTDWCRDARCKKCQQLASWKCEQARMTWKTPHERQKTKRPDYKAACSARHRVRQWAEEKGVGVKCDVSTSEWRAVLDRFGRVCAYCGDGVHRLYVDHAVPLSRGGQHVPSNCVPSCQRCNSRKKDRTVGEFEQWCRERGLDLVGFRKHRSLLLQSELMFV